MLMVRQVLRQLNKGGVFTVADLTAVLNMSEELVGQILDDLVRRGYLALVEGCSGACATCPLRGMCGPERKSKGPASTRSRLLVLTDQGKRGKHEHSG